MAGGEIDDPAAAKQSADTARGLPGFKQFLARKAPGMTGGAKNAIAECFTWKASEVSIGQAPT